MSNTCVIADLDCQGVTRCVCFACGENVCKSCSQFREWRVFSPTRRISIKLKRICDNCNEENIRVYKSIRSYAEFEKIDGKCADYQKTLEQMTAVAKIKELKKKKKLDKCQFCLGAKNGARGNENVKNGVIFCDDCHVLLMKVGMK